MVAQTKSTGSSRPAAVVLAGGLSRRMVGNEKSLIMLGKRPLLAYVLGRLAAQTAAIAISANGDPARFAEFGRPVLADTIEGNLGPLAGLLAGMIWAKGIGSPQIVSAPTDSPFIPGDLISRLTKAGARNPDAPVLASCGGRTHPVVGLWPVAMAGRLLDFLASSANHRVTDFANACGAVTEEFPMTALPGRMFDPFFNVNTPQDLAEAEALLQEGAR
jgi:molybdenum cofactor guanylyltransferase